MASSHGTMVSLTIVASASLPTQPWWPQLHQVIITAFLHKPENVTVFPPDWKRLPDDTSTAAQSLASELGDRGHLAVLLESQQPIACAGILPYRGDSWIDDVHSGKSDADIANAATFPSRGEGDGVAEWEVCCFCVSPAHRGRGISYRLLESLDNFIKARGAKRLYAQYAEIETGVFWPRMGFEVIPSAGGVLKKGFKVDPEKEGLRDDINFSMAVKTLNP